MTYKRIAQALEQRHKQNIAESTVRTHVGNMAWKLGVTMNVKAGVMAEIARRGLKFTINDRDRRRVDEIRIRSLAPCARAAGSFHPALPPPPQACEASDSRTR